MHNIPRNTTLRRRQKLSALYTKKCMLTVLLNSTILRLKRILAPPKK